MAWCAGINEARLLVFPESRTAEKCEEGEFLSLHHPKSGDKTCYLLRNESLYEIHWFKQYYGSWFVGDYICEDGRLYTATAVDPVFILLPMFEQARMKKGSDPGKFRQLDEIVSVNGYVGYQHLLTIAEKSMEVVCDCKEVGSTKFFRLNNSKVLVWLNCKVNRLEKTLPTLDKNYAARDHKETLADIVSLLGEYIKDEPWLKLLCSYRKIDLQENSIMKISAENTPVSSSTIQKERFGTDKKTTKSGRQTKKAKVEDPNSRNIKEMFTRASRKK